jgi:hypothetical protein
MSQIVLDSPLNNLRNPLLDPQIAICNLLGYPIR